MDLHLLCCVGLRHLTNNLTEFARVLHLGLGSVCCCLSMVCRGSPTLLIGFFTIDVGLSGLNLFARWYLGLGIITPLRVLMGVVASTAVVVLAILTLAFKLLLLWNVEWKINAGLFRFVKRYFLSFEKLVLKIWFASQIFVHVEIVFSLL